MTSFSNFELNDNIILKETLRIDLNKRRISGQFSAFKFVDKETKQHIVFIPSFDVSGYGETLEKANEMLKFCLDDMFDKLINMPHHGISSELSRQGWKKAFYNKQFSKAFVDIKGNLQNFNAETDSIQRLTLTAA